MGRSVRSSRAEVFTETPGDGSGSRVVLPYSERREINIDRGGPTVTKLGLRILNGKFRVKQRLTLEIPTTRVFRKQRPFPTQ